MSRQGASALQADVNGCGDVASGHKDTFLPAAVCRGATAN